jgi:hypothetical protein
VSTTTYHRRHILRDMSFKAWVPLLDATLHTPDSTFTRSPFLFSVSKYPGQFPRYETHCFFPVCAITCRYIPRLSHIYPLAMHFAKNEAATALLHGMKTVELAQAFIMMALYSSPAKRWEEDRGWLYTGLAIRCDALFICGLAGWLMVLLKDRCGYRLTLDERCFGAQE